MRSKAGEHPDEETLEKYLLGSLEPDEVARIEEHLLTCAKCVDHAGEMRHYIDSMRKALEPHKPKAKAARKGKPG